jgi:hypothetical protein
MQRSRLKIHRVWNHLTAVAAFLLTALINVAATEPAGGTRLSGTSYSKQVEAAAGLVRGIETVSRDEIDGDFSGGDPEPATLAAQPALYGFAALSASLIPADSIQRREPLALRSGLSRAPPSI